MTPQVAEGLRTVRIFLGEIIAGAYCFWQHKKFAPQDKAARREGSGSWQR
jgi:hypothetical protein